MLFGFLLKLARLMGMFQQGEVTGKKVIDAQVSRVGKWKRDVYMRSFGNNRAHNQIVRSVSSVSRLIIVILLASGFMLAAGVAASVTSTAQAGTGDSGTDGSTLVDEDFANSSAADKRWIVPNQEDGTAGKTNAACLTDATSSTAKPDSNVESPLWYCRNTTGSSYLTGQTPGFLQLTDASGGQTGTVLYNRALPISAGLDISFYQYQFGGTGADGIGFYLTDGSYNLSSTGPTGPDVGGALGYGSITKAIKNTGDTSQWRPGIDHGVLGIGLDRYGNFSRQGYVGVNCPGQTDGGPGSRAADSVTLRGAGNGTSGYCLLATQKLTNISKSVGTSAPTAATAGQDKGKLVRIVISPVTSASPIPTVTVYFDNVQVLSSQLDAVLPPTVKFGFTASTGGATDVHLIRPVKVKSVNPMGAISLVKTVNKDLTNGGTAQTAFTTGDDIPYSFLVTNTGETTLNGIVVKDKKVTGITCPATTLVPADSMVCTGTYHAVTSTEEHAGVVTNTAYATGTRSDTGTSVTSDLSEADAPTYSKGTFTLAKHVTGNGASAAADKTYTVKYSYPAGDYQYCNTSGSRTTPTAGDAGQFSAYTGGSMQIQGGKVVSSDPIPVGAVVTLTEDEASISGTTWSSAFNPSKTLTIGCSQSANTVSLTNTYTQQTGTASWTKTDADSGTLLAGSEWTLTDANGDTTEVVDNGKNDADSQVGALKVTGLAWGTYTLKETKAPDGYEVPDSQNDTLAKDPLTINASNLSISFGAIKNTKAQVVWHKSADESNVALSGSQWKLTGGDLPADGVVIADCSQATCSAPNANTKFYDVDPTSGAFKITGLPRGTYTLVEAEAPAGYKLSSEQHSFTLTASQPSYSFSTDFTDEQHDSPTLPHTGGTSIDSYLIGGALIMILSSGIGFVVRKRGVSIR
jgi:LPXTG-motif cell wall-anchored protein/uncharacterized repeat protein (TIGR01451 family)